MENYKQFLCVFTLALALGFVSVAFALAWVLHFREGLGWDGGAAEFNWHPLLMVIGFIFLQGIGKESECLHFSQQPELSHSWVFDHHLLLNSLTILIM